MTTSPTQNSGEFENITPYDFLRNLDSSQGDPRIMQAQREQQEEYFGELFVEYPEQERNDIVKNIMGHLPEMQNRAQELFRELYPENAEMERISPRMQQKLVLYLRFSIDLGITFLRDEKKVLEEGKTEKSKEKVVSALLNKSITRNQKQITEAMEDGSQLSDDELHQNEVLRMMMSQYEHREEMSNAEILQGGGIRGDSAGGESGSEGSARGESEQIGEGEREGVDGGEAGAGIGSVLKDFHETHSRIEDERGPRGDYIFTPLNVDEFLKKLNPEDKENFDEEYFIGLMTSGCSLDEARKIQIREFVQKRIHSPGFYDEAERFLVGVQYEAPDLGDDEQFGFFRDNKQRMEEEMQRYLFSFMLKCENPSDEFYARKHAIFEHMPDGRLLGLGAQSVSVPTSMDFSSMDIIALKEGENVEQILNNLETIEGLEYIAFRDYEEFMRKKRMQYRSRQGTVVQSARGGTRGSSHVGMPSSGDVGADMKKGAKQQQPKPKQPQQKAPSGPEPPSAGGGIPGLDGEEMSFGGLTTRIAEEAIVGPNPFDSFSRSKKLVAGGVVGLSSTIAAIGATAAYITHLNAPSVT